MPLFLKVGDNMVFEINNRIWRIVFTAPNSPKLRRSDNSLTVGVTDGNDGCIYLSDALRGAFLERVLCHELTHSVCMSWDISIPIETEEWLCNFMSDHGKEIIYLLDVLLSIIVAKRVA